MEIVRKSFGIIAGAVLVLGVFSGCESTDTDASVSGSMYYGVGFYDPWYYGDYDYDSDVIVTPPSRPPPQATQPIYNPSPRPTPMPSVPSAPRPSFRR
jgi:hypothetical protein